jgi:hypothetical protein
MWYVTYRIRRPRGVEHDRGAEVRIACSKDLEKWQDILTVKKEQYESASIEKSHLWQGKDKMWRYVTSYTQSDGRWCVALMKAASPSDFNPL